MAERSYGCTFSCGNPYDYIVISVADGSTEFLCLPCYLRLAQQIIEAVTEPGSEVVQRAMAEMGHLDTAPQTHDLPKPGKHHAPVTSEIDDVMEEYTSVIDSADLPDEFR